MIHGNATAWEQFQRDRPEAALLRGPRGVGKFTGATLAAESIAGAENVIAYQNVTVQEMRELVQWFNLGGHLTRVAVLEPGSCHANVWSLLKSLLENLPSNSHVWIIDSYESPAPRGVQDRCFSYQFRFLSPDEMRVFLEEAGTITLDQEYVETLGSVDNVLEMNRALTMKPAVATWIRAVEDRSQNELLVATKAWSQKHTDLLMAEISSQLEGASLVEGVRFRRLKRTSLLKALTLLHDGVDPKTRAIATGLSVMFH